ncbi:cyclin-dependent kinase inhibitor 3-like [Cucurbita maxima]|uniref:Cyclin-dependent kinase inhibitor 3-like n=1 Tax=Cucurbita maxima TaxID=3661 RepID=A0A6J1KTY9_CUCMA|nr:cyclin-dependent kinase inhibitor 3-like [Cucurbita maxima]
MGKYMNKSKIAGDITVMEVFSQPTTTTVRTRAASKSLALQKLQKSSLPDAIPDLSFSYLQLRTRRLDKTNRSIGASAKQTSKPKKSARSSSSSVKTTSNLDCESQIVGFESQAENLKFEISRRGASESTADNLQRTITPAQEIEEFFASAEHQQRRSFIDKYNYDIVNDKPLDGRYEWVELVP